MKDPIPPSAFDARRLSATLDSMNEGFQVIGKDWRYLYVNDMACRQGRKTREELLGRTMMEVYPGIDQAPFFDVLRKVMADRVPRDIEDEFVHEGGDREWFELRVQPSAEGVSILSLDVSARKRLEGTLRQAQKMEAIGQLAGGVAHDFNNLLTVITSFTSFVIESLPDTSAERNDLKEVLSAAERAAKLTRQLLSFSRQRPQQIEPASMNIVLTNLRPMLERLLGSGVKTRLELAPVISDVLVDVNAIEQVLVNLAVNARDAMPDGGDLTFETRDIELAEGLKESHHGSVLPPGSYVLISVSDTGSGMSREVLDRVFEPFYTTKPEGKGTGLGLATSYAIVRQAGGFIWVYSEQGRGSTFEVYLPRAAAADAGTGARSTEKAAGGSETVLVVEDDPQLVDVAQRVLAAAGYRTLTASSVEEAEKVAAAHEGPIHLLLMDVVLPERDGPELPARLASRAHVPRVLYMSGFAEGSLARRELLAPGSPLLEKPFGPEQLLRAVRQALS